MTPEPPAIPSPVSAEEGYAALVVCVLREHLPGFDPEAADIIAEAVEINARKPQARFECIVDDPRRSCWRLRARSVDHSRVRLAYYPVIPPGSESRRELERTVNDALRALEAGQ
jgi:hypothetical protein